MLLDAVKHQSGNANSYWTRMVLCLDNHANLDLLIYDKNLLNLVKQVFGVKVVLTELTLRNR